MVVTVYKIGERINLYDIQKIAILFVMSLFIGCSIPDKIINIQRSNIREDISLKDKKKILKKADILNNQGIQAYKDKKYEEAISYYKQSLNIKKRFLHKKIV